LQGFIIHLDSASPRHFRRSRECLEADRVTKLQHPADSPDLAPSDFFLLGSLKEKLIDFDCRSREDPKNAITLIFNEIDKETLVAVFVSWKQEIRNVGVRLTEKLAGHEPLDPPIVRSKK
jgi:hypothetical protein